MIKLVNLTQHDINIIYENGSVVIPASGQVARVNSTAIETGQIEGIPVVQTIYSDVDGLPDEEEGTVYIVSTLVLQALKANNIDRIDCVAPNTSPGSAVRDEQGRIIGVHSFQAL